MEFESKRLYPAFPSMPAGKDELEASLITCGWKSTAEEFKALLMKHGNDVEDVEDLRMGATNTKATLFRNHAPAKDCDEKLALLRLFDTGAEPFAQFYTAENIAERKAFGARPVNFLVF